MEKNNRKIKKIEDYFLKSIMPPPTVETIFQKSIKISKLLDHLSPMGQPKPILLQNEDKNFDHISPIC